MLLVSTFLEESGISGIGLFASQPVKEGEVVWKFDPITTLVWSKEQKEAMERTLPLSAFENMSRFMYLRHDKWMLNLDDSRFMNHSNDPNMGYSDTDETCFALRAISDGEELTINYRSFCQDEDPDYLLGVS